jgi:hypothetical protein
MLTATSFASTVDHQAFMQIMDEMNYEMSKSASYAERAQIAEAYEKRIEEAFLAMSNEEIAILRKELLSKVPAQLKADIDLLLSTIDFDKLNKEEKLRMLDQAVKNQYQSGASWDWDEGYFADFLGFIIILPVGLIVLFYGLTCGPSHNCDR